MKNIKYRAWGVDTEMMHGWEQVQKIDGWWKNDALVLMSWTGLLDKNGKEIYEGDVIVWWNLARGKRYRSNYHKKVVEWKSSQTGTGFGIPNKTKYWEIIGNIYENPEFITPRT